MYIKSMIEKKTNSDNNEPQKQVEIVFEAEKNGELTKETIVLTGNGSIRVLAPV